MGAFNTFLARPPPLLSDLRVQMSGFLPPSDAL